jgi:hypothetical protein
MSTAVPEEICAVKDYPHGERRRQTSFSWKVVLPKVRIPLSSRKTMSCSTLRL